MPRKTSNGHGGRNGKGGRQAEEPGYIVVRGAHEHNLHIDELRIPKRELVVFTGVSGSGKSSLAFDTLYAEGQRRYVESLSSYARQFLGQMDKPKYEQLKGLSPTIAIEQKSASSNPRSTVGTVTEIYDYLRVLYTRVGEQRCHLCGGAVAGRSAAEVVEELMTLPQRARATLLARKAENRKGEFRDLFEGARKAGFTRVRIDGTVQRLDEVTALDKKKKHTIELVIDRVVIDPAERARITDSVESGLKAGDGMLLVAVEGEAHERAYSETRACPACGVGLPELTPQSFSFNSPLGMCIDCTGLGSRLEVDPDLLVPDPSRSIADGAVELWGERAGRDQAWTWSIINAVSKEFGIPLDRPWKDLTPRHREIILFGAGDKRMHVSWNRSHASGSWAMRFPGVIATLKRRMAETQSEAMREHYQRFLREIPCRACKGQRLRPESRAVYVGGRSIVEVSSMTVAESMRHLEEMRLQGAHAQIAAEILKEVKARLGFLLDVGLDYLTLDRAAGSLAGGEAQRIRLASQLGSELSGVMYILDEPSIGLHQRDNLRLITTLRRLRDLGNTVIVVEHDAETIESADHVVDFGPGAGRLGGKVVAEGPPEAVRRAPASITGRYLAGTERIEVPAVRRQPKGFLTLRRARANNLRNLDVRFPLGVLVAVTGVSGAGKSSLVTETLHPALRRHLLSAHDAVGAHDALEGVDALDRVIDIDQQPIGRTPRSNPATYTKAFDLIREIFAQTPEARTYGYEPGRFSFNVRGGRCEACEGDGVRKVEMHFLPDVYVTCEVCKGRRYNEATLRVHFKGHSIADVLDMSISDALGVFAHHRGLSHILRTLDEVGLGYIALGQAATTLSGGEAQRVKLSRELAKRDTGRTIYLLDEPTTGLHFDDVRKLLSVLSRLVDAGNSVVVIEHNLDVIKTADHVIDIGPEGGVGGGQLVAEGTPEEIARVAPSVTGRFLAPLLARPRPRAARLR